MERIEPAAWTDDDRALWSRIAAHDFEPAGAALTFAGRLARDHGWSLATARAAIDEYRRFCFLALRAGSEVTPSEEVDEVWHQHLAYSRDYWLVWCREVLRHDLHHGPTLGGPAETSRFAAQYAETLAAYEAWFGPPPAALWPGTAERFGRPRFRIVDRTTHLSVRVPRKMSARLRRLGGATRLGAVLSLVSAGPASAATLNVLDWTAGPFLTLYAALAALSLAVVALLPSGVARTPSPGRARLAPAKLGFLIGGTARAADVLVLQDIAAGRAGLTSTTRRFGILSNRTDALTVGEQTVTRAWLKSEKSEEIEELRRELAEEGLAPSSRQRQSLVRRIVLLVGPVLLLGLAKVFVGLARDKPIGFLMVLLVLTAVAALVLADRRSRTSAAGRAFVEHFKDEHDRAIRAPRPDEVITAFAVVGAPALVGTAFEAYARMLKADDGGSGCGGGGGGGCGGGCGGCGGGD